MPGQPAALPAVEFTALSHPLPLPDVGDRHLVPFGFNDGADWDAYPAYEHAHRYLRWHQPLEAELAKQVEYDMDEQDQLWLDSLNADRKRDGHAPISYEVFEVIMDKIEKEWFDLTRNVPKRTNALPSEDSKCAICDDGECENANAIVFCDGCNLAVHQDCYGVPYIPEGQWLCRKCTVSPDKPVTCVLCPRSYGAFKQTTTGQWAHLLCAIWIPDTSVSNTVYMEPVDGIEHIPKSRWKLVCYLCKKRVGACIQCASRTCYTAFHVTCAREYGLSLKMKQGLGAAGELRAYCDKHGEVAPSRPGTPALGQLKSRPSTPSTPTLAGASTSTSLLKLTLKLPSSSSTPGPSNKTPSRPLLPAAAAVGGRAYKATLPSRGPPIVPLRIAERVVAYLGTKLKLPGKKDVVNVVCRYWSLKREARRGAPLLKRIHLEPWTASATSRQQSESDKAHKLELIRLLRNDLEKVRMLTERVRKRERKKLERAQCLAGVVDEFVWPLEKRLRDALEQVKSLDKSNHFLRPVDRKAVPDYYEHIHAPMDWQTMGDKLARHEYLTAQDFTDDVHLVINNARKYNKPHTTLHKFATRLLDLVEEPILDALVALDDPASDVHVRRTEVARVLTRERIAELWEFGYDVEDPEGKKKEAAQARLKEEEEAEALKKSKSAKKDVKGKGKARAATADEDDDEAMEVDGDDAQPEASTSRAQRRKSASVAPANPPTATSNRKKRSAELAVLDSPAPAARTTRAGTAAAVAAATPQPRTTRSGATVAKPVEAATADKARDRKGKGKALDEPVSARKAAPGSPNKGPAAELAPEAVDSKAMFKHFETGSTAAPPTPQTSTSALPEPDTAVSSATRDKKGKGKAAVEPVAEEDEDESHAAPHDAKEQPHETVSAPSKPSPSKKARLESPKKGDESGSSLSDAQQLRDWENKVKELEPSIAIDPKADLDEGHLVWARIAPHPFFPAEVVDADASDTPDSLRKHRPPKTDDKVPVMFFDDHRSCAWLPRTNLRELGDNPTADDLLVSHFAVRANRRKYKGKSWGKSIGEEAEDLAEALDWAKSLAENTDDEEARLAEESKSTAAAGGRKAGKVAKGKRKVGKGAGGRKR
ncbi:hypothetical protein Rhopal_002060-T1 [Rhodotorula paludigena]|uniref:Bromodomain and PHD finger-containing protein 3 n=1 Tax=Rhodotorula paludigena TaxID=86838 RepID=A0AAV5G923_9BASI|nr:hypothetical protein Rhopal_002060-T1 [Rhodotorula paludigena]